VGPITGAERVHEWDALVERSVNGTIFHHSWWLNAAGRDFTILGVFDGKGNLVGGMPLTFSNRYGLRLVRNPPLTPYLGPVFAQDAKGTSYKTISLMRNAGAILAESVRGIDSFSQHIGSRGPDLQGFLWRGYSADLRYTFKIDVLTDTDDILNRMHPKHRSELVKAQRRKVQIVESQDLDAFLAINRKTFERSSLKAPYRESLVRSLWEAASARGRALLLLARNAAAKTTDGAIFFSDSAYSYLVLAGGDPEHRGDGGGNAVIWEGIQRAHLSGRGFDFEGSSMPNIEFFYRRWGGTPYPTLHLHKTFTRRAQVAAFAKSCLARA
jgi:hypothetical protein